MRKLGVTDVGVDPNHGWRHSFKTRGRTGGMQASVLDAIQGHTPSTEGGKYGWFEAELITREIQLFPRYDIDPGLGDTIAA